MFIITMESESHSWVAAGKTLLDAKRTLNKAFSKVSGTKTTFDKLNDYYGTHIIEIKENECYMDSSLIK